MTAPLLLYSLSEFREVIFTGLETAGARRVMEVGSEAGLFTRELVAWVEAHDGELLCVEPAPTEAVRELVAGSSAVRLLEETSHGALAHTEALDAYLLDGDHNYFTVEGELAAIDRATREEGHHAVVFLQDVGWPCGRRDFYYAPERLPPEAVHPHTFDLGVVPGSDAPIVGGFRSGGAFAWALHEGGPRNGVRTALDDFLAGATGWSLVHVPCVFGLAVLFPEAAPWAEELRSALASYHDNPLLARLERNRLDLYLKVLELQDANAGLRLEYEGLLAERDSRLAAVETGALLAAQEARAAAAEADELRRSRSDPATRQGRRAQADGSRAARHHRLARLLQLDRSSH